jgi:hypothetical protein
MVVLRLQIAMSAECEIEDVRVAEQDDDEASLVAT